MVKRFKFIWRTPIAVLAAWNNDECLRLGASVAFYAIFSLAPLLAMAVIVAGLAFGVDAARAQIVNQIGTLVGQADTSTLDAMLDTAMVSQTRQWTSAVIGLATLFIGATGVFIELRHALDSINKQAQEVKHGLSWFVRARLTSFLLVLAVGFVALVSLALSAVLAATTAWLAASIPILSALVLLLDTVISLSLITFLFVLLLHWLPTVRLAHVSIWPGALVAAALFVVGKYLVGFYLGRAGVSDAYGAAGSLVIILIWVFYCTQALLIGAEYNKLRASRLGKRAGQE